MYYIYHIPTVKIGVSEQPKQRVANQGFSDYEILEEHTDIYEVSKRERELQKEYGYEVDDSPYWNSRKHWGAAAGKIGGNTNIEMRRKHMSKVGKSNKGKSLSKEHRRKLSEANRLRTHSEETKQKISEGNRGKTLSDETKRKISKSRESLTYQKAEYIRAQYKRGTDVFGKKITYRRLGDAFGVNSVSIMNIIHNKTYTTP